MALAWLNLLDAGRDVLRFAIDTGTSRYFQLKVGRARSTREGVDWVDEVYLTTPIKPNDAGGSLLPATREITVPASRLQRGDSYVQLVTYKSPDGRGPAFSEVVMVSGAPELRGRLSGRDLPGYGIPPMMPTLPMSVSRPLSNAGVGGEPFRTARKIPCVESPDELAVQTSIEDVLSGIVKVAGPIVLKMLKGDGNSNAGNQNAGNQNAGNQNAGNQNAGNPNDGTGGAPIPDGGSDSTVSGVVSFLLKTLLAGLQPAGGDGTADADKSITKSLSTSMQLAENRFVAAKRTDWSRPFIFGIDDALIGALAGPLLSVLPQLLNAANQERIQEHQANTKLASDALAQVNQRMLMAQLLQAQQKATGDQAAQLEALQQQLQAILAADTTSKAKSLSMSAANNAGSCCAGATPSARAALGFVAAEPVGFNGKMHLVFARNRDAVLKLRFTVGAPVPKGPLARAILALTLKGTHHPADWVKVEARLTNVAPNSVQTITVTQADLAKLPANRRIAVIAELRWPGSGGKSYCAYGSTDIVLVDKYFVKERGPTIGDERELTDMGRYRPFWNKIWEAPSLDALNRANTGGTKRLWELDANARYLVLLEAREQANGVMETRLNAVPQDPEDIRLTTSGRLKGGVELSLDEVNKLASLWDGQSPLDTDRLSAFRSRAIAHASSGEFISSIKLKGRANERGMVWVVPVFRLAEFALSSVQATDDSGQVVAVSNETVRLPIPVAARVLGLLSQAGDASDGATDSGDSAAAYKFDGYKIDVSQKVALTPIASRHRRHSRDDQPAMSPNAQLQST